MPANRKPSLEVRLRLAHNMQRLRKARGLTQRELAERCGMRNTYVSNVEQATVNICLAGLQALAEGLDCSEEDLLRAPSRWG